MALHTLFHAHWQFSSKYLLFFVIGCIHCWCQYNVLSVRVGDDRALKASMDVEEGVKWSERDHLQQKGHNKWWFGLNALLKCRSKRHFACILCPLFVPRELIREAKIQGYDIIVRMQVLIKAWAIGRNPGLWDKL